MGLKYLLLHLKHLKGFWKTFNHYEDDSIEKFKIYINNILKKSNKKRYISKNNQNIKRVDFISEHFPNSTILMPYREPLAFIFLINST